MLQLHLFPVFFNRLAKQPVNKSTSYSNNAIIKTAEPETTFVCRDIIVRRAGSSILPVRVLAEPISFSEKITILSRFPAQDLAPINHGSTVSAKWTNSILA